MAGRQGASQVAATPPHDYLPGARSNPASRSGAKEPPLAPDAASPSAPALRASPNTSNTANPQKKWKPPFCVHLMQRVHKLLRRRRAAQRLRHQRLCIKGCGAVGSIASDAGSSDSGMGRRRVGVEAGVRGPAQAQPASAGQQIAAEPARCLQRRGCAGSPLGRLRIQASRHPSCTLAPVATADSSILLPHSRARLMTLRVTSMPAGQGRDGGERRGRRHGALGVAARRLPGCRRSGQHQPQLPGKQPSPHPPTHPPDRSSRGSGSV